MSRTRALIAAAVVVVLVVAGGWYTVFRPKDTLTIAADFAATDGVYPGNAVHVLGVPVGAVRSLEPRGPVVRVTMELSSDIKIPAQAHAFIMSPQVISDRFVELTPAHTGGPVLEDGAVIPAERSHSPVRWDELMSSMDTILEVLGPRGANSNGDLGSVLHETAGMLDGQGQAFRDAVNTLSQASGIVAGNKDDLAKLLENLDNLVRVLLENKQTLDSLKGTVSEANRDFGLEQTDLKATIERLARVLSQVDTLVQQHGAELSGTLSNVARTSSTLASHQNDLGEILDVLPLTFGNFSRAITPDERLRIRLNISTNLSQFPATAELCGRFPIPMCSGPGLVNPIPFPPHLDVPAQLDAPTGGG